MIPLRDYLRRYHALASEREQLLAAIAWAEEQKLPKAVEAIRERLSRVDLEILEMESIRITTDEHTYDRT